MKAREVMTKKVFTCQPDAPLSEVSAKMSTHNSGFVPVVDAGDGRLLGVLTDRDALLAISKKNAPLDKIEVRDVMHRDVHCCNAEDQLKEVHRTMRKYHVRRVPISDKKGHLEGVISLTDLALKAYKQRDPAEQREVAKTLGAINSPYVMT